MEEGGLRHLEEVGATPINDETAQGLLIHKEQEKQCLKKRGHCKKDRDCRRDEGQC